MNIMYYTKMPVVSKYTLEDFENVIYNGFEYTIPDNVLETISKLAMEVGSPDYVKTPLFPKKERVVANANGTAGAPIKDMGKKKRGNKAMEITSNDDWEALRNFQTTKMDVKTGLDGDFDTIRSYINKLTDKNYNEMSTKIIELITKVVTENADTDLTMISANIFDIASSNRYYSTIYAQLYSDLSDKFEFIKNKYQENLEKFIESLNTIEYVDPNVNYDKFCEINKANEKRKSLAAFYLNLANKNVIPMSEIIKITRNLLAIVYEFISIDNKKNEVDELTEIIHVLYNSSEFYNEHEDDYEKINGFTINEIIGKISESKTKDYKSLTSRTLFKFMDFAEK
jgi:hypothetical protein